MIPCQNQESALRGQSAPLRKAFASRLHGIWIVGAALLIGAGVSRAAEPNVKMRPLALDGTWEIAATFEVTDKGWKFDLHDSDRNERVVISRSVLRVYRNGRDKPSEEMDFKILKLADHGVGRVQFIDKRNAIEMNMLYRFEGSRLMLCMHDDMDAKPTTFGARGTKIIVLIPYQQDRLIASVQLPKPKPTTTFQNVGGKVNPQPPPKKADE